VKRDGGGALRRWAFFLLCAAALAPASASAAAGVSNRELVELTDIDSLGVSPDGRYVVFRTVRGDVGSNSYVLRWHSIELSSGLVRDLGSGGDPVYLDPGSVAPERPLWTDGSERVVFRALVDGTLGLWSADLSGRAMKPLVVRDEDVEAYWRSPDGRAILYRVGPSREEIRRAERREYDLGILVDSTVDLAQNLFRGGSIDGRMATQRLVGYWYSRGGLLWRAPRQVRRFEPAAGRDEPVGEPEVPSAPDPKALAAPKRALSASGAVAEAASGSIVATLADGTKMTCGHPLCRKGRVSALVWRPGSEDVLVTFLDRMRRQSLHLWTPGSGTLRPITAAEGLLSGGRREAVPCAVSIAAAFCVAAGPASPPRLERIDLASGERRPLFAPNEAIERSYRPDVRFAEWRTDDGQSATGVLLFPTRGLRHAPLYLNYYSCEGFLRGGEGDEWPIPALLESGFAIACLNAVRFEGAQDNAQIYRAALAAIRPLVARLAGEGVIDPARVAMGGLSFGSEVAMYVAMNSTLLSAVSISSLQLEPAGYWTSAMPGSDQPYYYGKVWGLGPPEQTAAAWRRVTPVFNVRRIRAPVLFQLPEQEARKIPELYARLSSAGTPTELFAFPDEAHVKLQPRHRLAVYDRNLDWFRYWLQNVRDPNPSKADQYRRWDLLRQRREANPGRAIARRQATAPVPPAH
jgi:dipeptidyl aminopeptidase/acylaminoacyl peptidase